MTYFPKKILFTGNWTCAEGEFQCNSGYPNCITVNRICDGIHQCSDGSDEITCGKFDQWNILCSILISHVNFLFRHLRL